MQANEEMPGPGPAAEMGQADNTKRRSRRDRQTVTLADVAKLVGVSSSTVSRVVNNSIPVSAELRQAIEPRDGQVNLTSGAGTWTA